MGSEDVSLEFSKEDDMQKTVYYFKSSKYRYETKSKEVYKKEDKFTIFPYFYNKRFGEVRPTFGEIKSITFEGFNQKFPLSGFRKSIKDGGGYGVTGQLKPLFKAIQDNLEISGIIISKKDKTKLNKDVLTLNYGDLETIRKPINSVLGDAREKSKVLANNFLANHFPSKIEELTTKYQKGTINRVIIEHSDLEKKLAPEDKEALHSLFEKLSFSDKEFFERQEFLTTKTKLEKKFIEDVLSEFKRKLSLKRIGEEKWQEFFKSNGWIFSQLFAYPAVLFNDKAYVGGTNVFNKEGKIADFLYKNDFSGNLAFIEIKTDKTPIMSKRPYRGTTVFSISSQLSGGINQVLDQKANFEREFYALKHKSSEEFTTRNSKCFVIIGTQTSLSNEQKESFELFRHSCKDVEIVTFDELLSKIKAMFELLGLNEDDSKTKIQKD